MNRSDILNLSASQILCQIDTDHSAVAPGLSDLTADQPSVRLCFTQPLRGRKIRARSRCSRARWGRSTRESPHTAAESGRMRALGASIPSADRLRRAWSEQITIRDGEARAMPGGTGAGCPSRGTVARSQSVLRCPGCAPFPVLSTRRPCVGSPGRGARLRAISRSERASKGPVARG